MVKVILRNMGRAPKGCHDIHGKAVMVPPNKEAEADLSEHTANFLLNADSDLVVIVKSDQGDGEPRNSPRAKLQKSGAKDSSKPGKAVPVPAEWQTMGWNARRKLAMDISGGKVANGDEANAIIEAELERQANL